MSSSTRPSSLVSTAAALGLALGFTAGSHLVLDGIATFAETRLDAYLWKAQDHLRVLSSAYHESRGARRLLIYGPSEAREGLLPEEIAAAVPGLEPYQNAQSMGTLDDGLLVLEYIERAYGRAAVPEAILLGISTRFIADFRPYPSPLVEGIRRYSPHFTVPDGEPRRLVPKSAADALAARARLLSLQPDRYRRGVAAVVTPIARAFAPVATALERRTRAARYFDGRMASDADIRRWLTDPSSVWPSVYGWEPASEGGRARTEIGRLRETTARLGTRLYVVNLPESPWVRERYLPGRYEQYLDLVREELGGIPFLDLRTFLRDDEFFDQAHPTWRGARRLSAAVGAFVAQARERDGGRR